MKYLLPPHDDAAEQQVLANILLDNKLLNDLPKDISKCFFNKQNADIYKAMLSLKNALTPIDLTNINNISTANVTVYLSGIVDNSKPSMFAEAAKSINDNYLRRETIRKAQEIMTTAYDTTIPVKDILASALNIISSMVKRSF